MGKSTPSEATPAKTRSSKGDPPPAPAPEPEDEGGGADAREAAATAAAAAASQVCGAHAPLSTLIPNELVSRFARVGIL